MNYGSLGNGNVGGSLGGASSLGAWPETMIKKITEASSSRALDTRRGDQPVAPPPAPKSRTMLYVALGGAAILGYMLWKKKKGGRR